MRIVLLLLILLILPEAYAQGIGVSPAVLEFDLAEGDNAERQITIYSNANEEFVAEPSPDFVAINPGSGTVNGEKKLIVRASGKKPGEHNGQIAIQFTGNGGGMRLNTGAVVKVLMNVKERETEKETENQTSVIKGMSITSGIVLVGLAGYFAWRNQPGIINQNK